MNADTNIEFTTKQLKDIRSLDDFDLIMFLSEMNGYGYFTALKLLDTQIKLKKKV